MKPEKIMKGIEGLSDGLISRYDDAGSAKKAEKNDLWVYLSVAACAAVVLLTVMLTRPEITAKAVERTPTPEATLRITEDLTKKSAASGIKYYNNKDKYVTTFYGKEGYDYYLENGEIPEDRIGPEAFFDVDRLKRCVSDKYDDADYEFECEDGVKFHIHISTNADFGIEGVLNSKDYYEKNCARLVDYFRISKNYSAIAPDVKNFEKSYVSADMNDCKEGSGKYSVNNGELIYSYVEGKLSCIYYYHDTVAIEIYSDEKQNWINSLDGWLKNLSDVDTANEAVAELEKITEDSYRREMEYLRTIPKNEWPLGYTEEEVYNG